MRYLIEFVCKPGHTHTNEPSKPEQRMGGVWIVLSKANLTPTYLLLCQLKGEFYYRSRMIPQGVLNHPEGCLSRKAIRKPGVLP